MLETIGLIGFFALLSLTVQAQSPRLEHLNPPGWSIPPGYSQAVKVQAGTTVYLSGQVPTNAQGQLVGQGDFAAQVRQVFANLQTVLQAAGATFADVVKVNYYVVGLTPERRNLIREVRANYLDLKQPPASTLVGVTALYDPEVLIEIEVVAVVK
ncbi:MAG: RidA family protein [Bernardetiaceae bacterium]|jgi:enamine deaminase RidA (YjgF/YER057c/UK114 family)|nr:RidA family protein [Bernardetiaceae bacterium]